LLHIDARVDGGFQRRTRSTPGSPMIRPPPSPGKC
jgi:hypothetical protein